MSPAMEIGQELWKQLKRVSIPVFNGDKTNYENWKAAFEACIDKVPSTPEYKLLQLRQYLSGEALKAIENLGHSASAYEEAKSRLERKYCGRRRQIALHLEELDNFKPVRPGHRKDIERFTDILDIAVVNLKEARRNEELGNGPLYAKLQKKMTEQMLAQYHRWVYKRNKTERRNFTRVGDTRGGVPDHSSRNATWNIKKLIWCTAERSDILRPAKTTKLP